MTTKELRQVLDWADEGMLQNCSIATEYIWKDVQYNTNYIGTISSTEDFSLYRRKPTSTLRPWKPEEVPVGAVVRSGANRWLITAVWQGKLFLNGCDLHDDERSPSLETLTVGYTYSLDHGVTWLPCGVYDN